MANDSVSNINFTPDKGNDFRSKGVVPKKTKKDFKKVLAKEGREERNHHGEKGQVKEDKSVKGKEGYEDVVRQQEELEASAKTTKVSLFDLSAAPEEVVEAAPDLGGEEISVEEIPEEMQQESLSALFKGYGSKEKLKMLQAEASAKPPTSAVTAESKGKGASTFTQEQPDLSSINPMAVQQGSIPTAEVKGPEPSQTTAAQRIQEVIDQIIDKLYTLKTSGKTDTLITVKHPPLFAGTNIVISAFDTAKGEFNIAFENLTQAAKQVLDMRDSQDALKFGLEQKGYTVHIITTTTLSETQKVVEGQPQTREDKEGQEDDSQKQRDDEQES